MRERHHLLLLSLLLISLRAAHADVPAPAPEPVGHRGDIALLLFEGCKQTPADAVRDAIRQDMPCIVAALPSSPFPDYLATLRTRLQQGYLQSGYPDAQLQVEPQGDHIRIAVTEGPRFHNGKIIIHAPPAVDADLLTKNLLEISTGPRDIHLDTIEPGTYEVKIEPEKKSEDAAWTLGDATDFRKETIEWKATVAGYKLQNQGFFQAKVTSTMARHDGIADLQLDIDPGPKAVLGKITVNGNKRNSTEKILAAAGLKEGMPADGMLLRKGIEALLETGRFEDESLQLHQPDGQNRATLELTVIEAADCPTLAEPLTPEQATLVRMGTYIRTWQQNGTDDVSVHIEDIQLSADVAFTRDGKCGLHLKFAQDIPGLTNYVGKESLITISSDSIRFFRPGDNVNLLFPFHPTGYELRVFFRSHAINFGPSFDSEKQFAAGIPLHLFVDPAGLIRMATEDNTTLTHRDGNLIVTRGNRVLTVDEATGRPSIIISNRDDASALAWNVRFVPGAYAELIKPMEKAGPVAATTQPGELASSTLQFLLNAVIVTNVLGGANDADADKRTHALAALLTPKLMASFHLDDSQNTDNSDFSIESNSPRPSDKAGLIRSLAELALCQTRSFFARDTWPDSLSSQTLLDLAGDGKHATNELRRFYRNDAYGPLAMLAAAEVFNFTDHDLCRSMAEKGLARLTPDAFITDCRPLLDPKTPGGQTMLSFLESVRGLDAGEIDSLLALLPEDNRPAIRAIWAGLKATGTQPLAGAWEPALRNWWADKGKALVEARLRHYAPAR